MCKKTIFFEKKKKKILFEAYVRIHVYTRILVGEERSDRNKKNLNQN